RDSISRAWKRKESSVRELIRGLWRPIWRIGKPAFGRDPSIHPLASEKAMHRFVWVSRRALWTAGALVLVGVFLIDSPQSAVARIKLITLPVRERVEIQLDNPGATLVEEERIVPLVKGENQVDFSWANTQIDPGTIVFRVVAPVGEKPLEVKVI